MNYPIRPANITDATELARLFNVLGYGSNATDLTRRLAQLLNHADHFVAVLEVNAGGLAGCLHAQLHRTLASDLTMVVVAMIVDQPFRRSGIGRALMASAENWALKKGCRAAMLRTNTTRPEAPAFYERLGYARTKTQFSYRKILAG